MTHTGLFADVVFLSFTFSGAQITFSQGQWRMFINPRQARSEPLEHAKSAFFVEGPFLSIAIQYFLNKISDVLKITTILFECNKKMNCNPSSVFKYSEVLIIKWRLEGRS